MEISIKTQNEVKIEEWNSYVIKTSGNPSQLFEYGTISRGLTPLFVEITENNMVIFRWLIYYSGKKYLGYINIISEPNTEDEKLINLALDKITKEYNPFKIIFHSITLSRFKNIEFLKNKKFSKIFKYGSAIVDLKENSIDEIFSNIHSKHRNVIRRAEREGIIVYEKSNMEGVEDFFEMAKITYSRSNMENLELDYLKKHFLAMKKGGNCRIFFSRKEEINQAALFLLLTKKRSIYWHGASINKPSTGSANFLHFEVMKKLKEEGVELYDFGGLSLNTEDEKARGIDRFKERFGGKIEFFYGGELIISKIKKKTFESLKKMMRR